MAVPLGRVDAWNRRLRTVRLAGYQARERVVRGGGPTRVGGVATVSEGFFEVVGVLAYWVPGPRRRGAGNSRGRVAKRCTRRLRSCFVRAPVAEPHGAPPGRASGERQRGPGVSQVAAFLGPNSRAAVRMLCMMLALPSWHANS